MNTALDDWNETFPPGTSVFWDSGRWQQARTEGAAFEVSGDSIIRVTGHVGAVPIHCVRKANEGEAICTVCSGEGCFPEATQLIDREGYPPDCSFCSRGITNPEQRAACAQQAKLDLPKHQ